MEATPVDGLRIGVMERLLGGLAVCVCCLSLAQAQSPAVIEVGKFSTAQGGDAIQDGWQPLRFKKVKRYTSYSLVRDAEEDEAALVVRAESHGAASGLSKEIQIDPKEYPIIEWRWKVENVLQKGDVMTKEGDDYPARIYVAFQYDSGRVSLLEKVKYEAVRLLYGRYPPLGAINYIWESKAPVGTIVPNPYAGQVMMFVVRSGSEELDAWLTEERNVYEDYKLAFGTEPSMISGVAIMTDTDNTGESATAYFGDIVFKKEFFR